MSDPVVVTNALPDGEPSARHPRFLEPASLLLITPLCILGAIIGMQLLVTLGITANTSLIGAVAAMLLARIPMAAFVRYRSIHVQNLAQTAISSATFGAGNSLLLPIGIPFVLGREDLVLPLLAGVFMAMLLDAYLLYRMFDSEVFPATGAWPPGVAAAEAIRAGDKGGRSAAVLAGGLAVGAGGAWLGVPMSAFGVAFIGNFWALLIFGVGLLTRGYSSTLFGGDAFASLIPNGDLAAIYIPHGFMVGAGLVALVQVVLIVVRRSSDERLVAVTRSQAQVRRTLGLGALAFVVIASLIALGGGLAASMSPGFLLLFIVYAASAALVHELIVGLAAMHSGWFPAFAVALITLVVGILIGFPPSALALLVGFSAATGPAFADMGYDLKAGYILRGNGLDREFELDGRRQQLFPAMFAFVVAGIVVSLSYPTLFAQGLVAPVTKVYAASIAAGVAPSVASSLALWAIPGALLQWAGGPKRQLGVLFATGMLIPFPVAGWAVLAGLAARKAWERLASAEGQATMEVFAAGVIAGDALYGFFDGVRKSLTK